ncbi:MATE family efflux transporter [Candidatus Soleaferrea massiliensis]|uniref:MATE family efflux transporter n=1 Tax=Candidatus Soleaferrea massiliensis TaxID=1470354 RepID=UPI000694D321|nr:MATE family efflux transporter [Candidatus Soleaferrea massiliensis]
MGERKGAAAVPDNALSQDFRAASLLRFAAPSILMMLFMGLYTVADTMFVARFVNTDALASLNIVCPVINLTVGLSAMLAAGGNAVISRKLGQRRRLEAKQDFTLLLLAGLALGVLLTVCGFLWIDRLIGFLGADDTLFPYCKEYLGILLLFLPANILQGLFQNLFVTAGRPALGFGWSFLAGTANILLDYLFMVPLQMGIRGAALGTGISYLIPAAAGILFFSKSRGTLCIVQPRWNLRMLLESCANGSSEMVGQLAAAVTAFLFNLNMMRLLGEDGVAAVTIMIYSQFLLNTLFLGYGIGVAPVIGYNHGGGNAERQRTVFRISMRFIAAISMLVFLVSWLGGPQITALFAEKSSEVYRIAAKGFSIFSFSFLFCGFNIYASAMLTALSNGRVSAVLSCLRTLGLVLAGLLLLPGIWGVTGVWLAVPLAEFIMVFISAACLRRYGGLQRNRETQQGSHRTNG